MQTIRVEVNNVRLWTIRQGQGVPFVLCHGGPGAYDYLETVAGMVDDLCTVIRYDQRGSGRSEGQKPADKNTYTLDTFLTDLDGLRQYFGFERWIVGGHSSGAALALAHAVAFPAHTTALVYLSGTGIDPGWHAEYRRNRLAALNEQQQAEYLALRTQRDTLLGTERERVQRRLRELSSYADVADVSYAEYLPHFAEYPTNDTVNILLGAELAERMETPDFRQTLETLALPSLLVHGEADPRPSGSVVALAKRLSGANYFLLPRAGHFPWIEQPHAFRRTLRRFLTDVTTRRQDASTSDGHPSRLPG